MKLKTKKAAAKRFKFSATGKIKIKKAGMRHNLGNKSSKKKQDQRAAGWVVEGFRKHVEKCLPYGNRKTSR